MRHVFLLDDAGVVADSTFRPILAFLSMMAFSITGVAPIPIIRATGAGVVGQVAVVRRSRCP